MLISVYHVLDYSKTNVMRRLQLFDLVLISIHHKTE
jgi:hypothetical protein